jgi:putative flippase GtrA
VTGWGRFARFNVVSVAGFVVQLAAVALLTRWLDVPGLVATGLGVGAAVVHNFYWHWRWTWADRLRSGYLVAAIPSTVFRFAAGNGLVSLVGNLCIVATLVETIGLDIVLANVVAVAACGVLNFQIGDRVVFRAARRAS